MRVIDEKLLKSFRGPGRCGWCKRAASVRHCHHLFSRGAGRVDVRENLIGLCPLCHDAAHTGHVTRGDLLAVVAAREGCQQQEIRELIWRLRRTQKG